MWMVPCASVERSMPLAADAPGGDNNPPTRITIRKAFFRDIDFNLISREGRPAVPPMNS